MRKIITSLLLLSLIVSPGSRKPISRKKNAVNITVAATKNEIVFTSEKVFNWG